MEDGDHQVVRWRSSCLGDGGCSSPPTDDANNDGDDYCWSVSSIVDLRGLLLLQTHVIRQ